MNTKQSMHFEYSFKGQRHKIFYTSFIQTLLPLSYLKSLLQTG